MALKLNRAHATEPAQKQVVWNRQGGTFELSGYRKVAGEWIGKPVEDFAIDVWQAQHGWKIWVDGKPQYILASASDDIPSQPEGGTPIHVVPVYRADFGTQQLLIEGIGVTNAFLDLLLDELAPEFAEMDGDDLLVPVVKPNSKGTANGLAPVFTVESLMPRLEDWAAPIVSFK